MLALFYALQRFLIYLPSSEVLPLKTELPGAEEIRFSTSDGLELDGWFLPSPNPGGPAILVANGNAGNRSHRAPLAKALAEAGASVLLFDYRGFGGNPGRPSEEGLHRDVLGALRYLAGRPEVDPKRIVYFGESIGAAVMVRLSAEHPPAGLVLRSPFTSLADVGKLHYPWLPVRLLLKDRYESASTISQVNIPVLVLAGGRDTIIPASQSRAVYEAAPGTKQFVEIPGADHNDPELFIGEQLISEVERFIHEVT
ncbi:MAG: alpha/beta hydrolase [Actinomycetota bacterium]|nr:alpha/beta hydrolase [Actinomycetota bacterium]